jgi:Zn-dependent peptidase ImmA (M78 family)
LVCSAIAESVDESMNWREAHEEAMFAAADAHEELQLDTTRRIDVFWTIEHLGLELLFRPLRGASGLYVPGPNRSDGGVLINSHHRLARQRFTGAHELGHFWLEHEASLDLVTEVLARAELGRLTPQEMTAEAFAAWFLMPPELVDAVLDDLELTAPRSADDVYALSLRMGTSYEATAYHLPNLKLIDYPTARQFAAQPPKRVKVALSMGVEMDSYYRDVWSLSERDADAAFQVGAGDRLVVTLSEIPSSGYMWSTQTLPAGARIVADTMTDVLASTERDVPQSRGEPPGAPHPRTVIVDLDEEADGEIDLSLVKAPVWAPQEGIERFLVHLAIERPLLGRPVSS